MVNVPVRTKKIVKNREMVEYPFILSEIDYPGTECICLTCVCSTFRFVCFCISEQTIMEHSTFNDNCLFSCESKAATLVFVKTEDGCL